MPTESTRAVVLQYFECIRQQDFQGILSLGDPAAPCWIAGPKDKFPLAGVRSYEKRFTQDVPPFFDTFKSREVIIVSLTVEGDSAVAEAKVKGEGINGKTCEYVGVAKFVVKNEKVAEIREYLDLFPILEFLGVGEGHREGHQHRQSLVKSKPTIL